MTASTKMSDLQARLIKASTTKLTATLTKSKLFKDRDEIRTRIPMLNIALSGAVDGGLGSGLLVLAGASKSFKCKKFNEIIELYNKVDDTYIKQTSTYGEFYNTIKNGNNEAFYVKTPYGHDQVLAACEKETDSYSVKFINGQVEVVGDNHAFYCADEDKEGVIFAKDLVYGDNLCADNGAIWTVESSTFHKANDIMYDIQINSPHWYYAKEDGLLHHNTLFGLTLIAAYMKKYPEAICLFYDSEFGASETYFRSMGVDMERVIHTPIQSVEQLKIDMVNQLEAIERGEKVILFIDSIGNTASKKETQDALDEKDKADFTRAKSLKSMFRIVTPYLTTKDIPCVAINHTAMEIGGMYPKEIMGGGVGILYSANTVLFIGKRQVKDGTELKGYEFVLKAEKSRSVKEKSQFPITVNFDGGIDPFSGMLELAQDIGFVVKPTKGWYSRAFLDEETGEVVPETVKWREAQTDDVNFWKPLFQHEPFREAIKARYKLGEIGSSPEIDAEVESLIGMKTKKHDFNAKVENRVIEDDIDLDEDDEDPEEE